MPSVLAMGLDYLRYRVHSAQDIRDIQTLLPYLQIIDRNYHGSRFVDLSGKQLEVVRTFNNVANIACRLASWFVVSRIDVFIDVEGNRLGAIEAKGTIIVNDGRIETIYSHNLKNRGNVPAFCRAYDARAAGHYDRPSTRFECEFKREAARALLTAEGWTLDPIGVMLHNIALHLGVTIDLPDHAAIDMDAPQQRYSHSRERFYLRYGQSIARDIEAMGVKGVYEYIQRCIADKEDANGKLTLSSET